MAPGKDKELQLVDNIRVADVEVGLQPFAVDPSVELQVKEYKKKCSVLSFLGRYDHGTKSMQMLQDSHFAPRILVLPSQPIFRTAFPTEWCRHSN